MFRRTRLVPGVSRKQIFGLAKVTRRTCSCAAGVLPFGFGGNAIAGAGEDVWREPHSRPDLADGRVNHFLFGKAFLLTQPATVLSGVIPVDVVGGAVGLRAGGSIGLMRDVGVCRLEFVELPDGDFARRDLVTTSDAAAVELLIGFAGGLKRGRPERGLDRTGHADERVPAG